MEESEETRDMAIFQLLVNELPGEEKKTEAKIRRKLSRAHLGAYDDAHVNQMRMLHRELQEEIGKFQGSKYYRGSPGSIASPDSFDADAMVQDYRRKYPSVSDEDLGRIIGFAVYAYYLR